MIDTTPLGLFVVTFVFVSLTPGLCMTLSLTLGIAIGVRRTLWMMAGELLGVGSSSLQQFSGSRRSCSTIQRLNRVSGSLIILVGIWLALI